MTNLLNIVIVGRPNVGKSTLFNRLAGRRTALVSSEPGMTRDRREEKVTWMGLTFLLSDTPGIFDSKTEAYDPQLARGMREMSLKSLKHADLVWFVIDGRDGVTPYDEALVQLIRPYNKPVWVIVNKCEKNEDHAYAEGISLSFGREIVCLSAEHGLGLAELFERLHPICSSAAEEILLPKPLRVSILGRPNVGKSTLINRLLGEERLLTADQPGVTRDSIHVPWNYKGRSIDLVDTAGLRRRKAREGVEEKISVVDTEKTLQYTDHVIFVIDASRPRDQLWEKQDLALLHHISQEGRGIVIALNKWDSVKKQTHYLKVVQDTLTEAVPDIRGVSVVPISAYTGEGLDTLWDKVFLADTKWNKRLSTSVLNRWLEEQVMRHSPPIRSGRRIRLKYMTQTRTRPPTFVLFASKSGELPESYLKFLINRLRDDFDWGGTPLRLTLKSSQNPYKTT